MYSLNLVFITIVETFGLHEQAKTDPVSCPILLSTANLPPATCSQLIRIEVAAVHTHSFIPLSRHSRDRAEDKSLLSMRLSERNRK